MKKSGTLTNDDVKKIAKLANIPLKSYEVGKITRELSDTLNFIQEIKKIDTKGIIPTHHVTGLSNVFREDAVTSSLTQKQALSGSQFTHLSYFKVPAVLEE